MSRAITDETYMSSKGEIKISLKLMICGVG